MGATMLKVASKLRAGAKKFVRTYNGKPRWFDAVTESLPYGSVVRRGVNGSYYVVQDGSCVGSFGYEKGPVYFARNPTVEQTFKAAEARWQDKTVLIEDGKIKQMVRGILRGTKAFKDSFGERSWFELVAAEAPRYGYTIERSNYGGYALFQGEIDKAVIGFVGGPTFTAYSPIAEDFLESVKSKWKGKKRK